MHWVRKCYTRKVCFANVCFANKLRFAVIPVWTLRWLIGQRPWLQDEETACHCHRNHMDGTRWILEATVFTVFATVTLVMVTFVFRFERKTKVQGRFLLFYYMSCVILTCSCYSHDSKNRNNKWGPSKVGDQIFIQCSVLLTKE